MKSVLLSSPESIKIIEMEKPVKKLGEALIRVRSVGICGSDIGAFRGTNPLISYPRIIGHEIAGEIVEIDEIDENDGLKVGGRVIVNPYIYCKQCYPCLNNRTNCCEDLRVLGVHVDGGMQEYFTHPANLLVPVPENISWEHVPLVEPLTIALHAIHRTKLAAGEHIAVNGAGAIGLLVALCAFAYGAVPIVVDVIDHRLAFARELGIVDTINASNGDMLEAIREKTDGRMAEVVVEASGANEAIQNTLYMASYIGRIALTGWPKDKTSLSTDLITKKELDILGSRTSAGEFEEAIRLIETGKVNAKAILSNIISFDEIPRMIQEQSKNPDKYLKINALL